MIPEGGATTGHLLSCLSVKGFTSKMEDFTTSCQFSDLIMENKGESEK